VRPEIVESTRAVRLEWGTHFFWCPSVCVRASALAVDTEAPSYSADCNAEVAVDNLGVGNDMGGWRKTEGGLFVPDTVAGAWDRVAKNRYVAHVDMLGMTELTLQNPERAWHAASKMTIAKKKVLDCSMTIDGRHFSIKDHVAAFTFSDTILLFTKGDDMDDLRTILIVCLELLAQTIHGSIPVRIGVAHGQFVFNGDEGLFVGPPLIHAYRLGEAAQWIGAVVDQTVAERASTLVPALTGQKLPLVVQWDVPIKGGGTERHPVLAWPHSHKANFTVPAPISLEDFCLAFERLFEKPLADFRPSDRAKYSNTLAFVNQMLESSSN